MTSLPTTVPGAPRTETALYGQPRMPWRPARDEQLVGDAEDDLLTAAEAIARGAADPDDPTLRALAADYVEQVHGRRVDHEQHLRELADLRGQLFRTTIDLDAANNDRQALVLQFEATQSDRDALAATQYRLTAAQRRVLELERLLGAEQAETTRLAELHRRQSAGAAREAQLRIRLERLSLAITGRTYAETMAIMDAAEQAERTALRAQRDRRYSPDRLDDASGDTIVVDTRDVMYAFVGGCR